jgi:protein-L-isoaspartate(D-aspartate) O-methyltransferase
MTAAEPVDLLSDSIRHRRTMVDCQIRTFDVTNPSVIARFLDVPRELFLPSKWKTLAYSDNALEVTNSAGSTRRQLLPPLVLARLLQNCSFKQSDHVLDIAAGTGYSTALLAGLAAKVTSLETDKDLAAQIETNLKACDISQVYTAAGRLSEGVAKHAPYDVIFVNGAVEAELETLFGQLNEGGRLVAIQRDAENLPGRGSKAVRFEKIAGEMSSRYLFDASAALLEDFRKKPQFVF